ncbi:MAG: cysteine hydrolase [Acidobacteriales bacterium]|nr:cysteine hydrolase [Terriglobales bacterium]
MSESKPALILIDIQQGFDDPRWGGRNNPKAEGKAAELLQEWRKQRAPIFHVQHSSRLPDSPLRPNQPGWEIKKEVAPQPGEPRFNKDVNSCFIGTGLEQELRRQGISEVVICGLTTDHCVSTSVRMGGNLGFKIYVPSDATATFDRKGPDGKTYSAQQMHETALASLHDEFATVATSQQIIARVFGHAEKKAKRA